MDDAQFWYNSRSSQCTCTSTRSSHYLLTFNGFMLPEGRDKMIEEVLNVNIWAGFSTLS